MIEIRQLSKTYRGNDGADTLALSETSLDVRAREIVTIVGPSGCGKSTLLRMVAGLATPSTGSVAIAGQPVTAPRTGTGVVFQASTLLPWATVLDNVLFPARIAGRRTPALAARARELLRLSGLADFERAMPHQLSGGMRQRATICRALLLDPDVLLLDEPFGALDALTREEMTVELLNLWQRAPLTILFVTHSITEAVLLGDRVVVMSPRPGRVEAVIDIDLPRPRPERVEDSPAFVGYARQVRELIFGQRAARGTAVLA